MNKIDINTEPFINEINDVIKKNINEIFNKFSEKHKLYEDSHNAVIQLGKIINLNSDTKINEQIINIKVILDEYIIQNNNKCEYT